MAYRKDQDILKKLVGSNFQRPPQSQSLWRAFFLQRLLGLMKAISCLVPYCQKSEEEPQMQMAKHVAMCYHCQGARFTLSVAVPQSPDSSSMPTTALPSYSLQFEKHHLTCILFIINLIESNLSPKSV